MKRTARIASATAAALALFGLGIVSATVATGQDGSRAADAPAAAGSPNADPASVLTKAEDVYTPVAPCRIVDSRKALGSIPEGGIRSYEVRGATGFVAQGGTSGGCGIPVNATAVSFTLSVVNPTDGGYLRAWPEGQVEPTATVLNFVRGESQTTTAPITLGAKALDKDLRVRSFSSSASLVIDVQGYYAPQIQGQVDVNGTLAQGTTRVVSSTRIGTGIYSVTVDRNLAGCTVASHPYGSGGFLINGYVTSANGFTAYAYRLNGTAVDINWQFSVTC